MPPTPSQSRSASYSYGHGSSTSKPSGSGSSSAAIHFRTLRPHPQYYLSGGDLFLLVESYHFRVHRYFFERESDYFRSKLAYDEEVAEREAEQGTSDATAIMLEDVSAEEFCTFLWVFYNPKYSLYDATCQEWRWILKLAWIWGFWQVHKLCIEQLESFSPIDFSPVDKVTTYNSYGGPHNLLLNSYIALVVRHQSLDVEEGLLLGMDVVIRITSAREQVRLNCSSIDRKDLLAIIGRLFGTWEGVTGIGVDVQLRVPRWDYKKELKLANASSITAGVSTPPATPSRTPSLMHSPPRYSAPTTPTPAKPTQFTTLSMTRPTPTPSTSSLAVKPKEKSPERRAPTVEPTPPAKAPSPEPKTRAKSPSPEPRLPKTPQKSGLRSSIPERVSPMPRLKSKTKSPEREAPVPELDLSTRPGTMTPPKSSSSVAASIASPFGSWFSASVSKGPPAVQAKPLPPLESASKPRLSGTRSWLGYSSPPATASPPPETAEKSQEVEHDVTSAPPSTIATRPASALPTTEVIPAKELTPVTTPIAETQRPITPRPSTPTTPRPSEHVEPTPYGTPRTSADHESDSETTAVSVSSAATPPVDSSPVIAPISINTKLGPELPNNDWLNQVPDDKLFGQRPSAKPRTPYTAGSILHNPFGDAMWDEESAKGEQEIEATVGLVTAEVKTPVLQSQELKTPVELTKGETLLVGPLAKEEEKVTSAVPLAKEDVTPVEPSIAEPSATVANDEEKPVTLSAADKETADKEQMEPTVSALAQAEAAAELEVAVTKSAIKEDTQAATPVAKEQPSPAEPTKEEKLPTAAEPAKVEDVVIVSEPVKGKKARGKKNSIAKNLAKEKADAVEPKKQEKLDVVEPTPTKDEPSIVEPAKEDKSTDVVPTKEEQASATEPPKVEDSFPVPDIVTPAQDAPVAAEEKPTIVEPATEVKSPVAEPAKEEKSVVEPEKEQQPSTLEPPKADESPVVLDTVVGKPTASSEEDDDKPLGLVKVAEISKVAPASEELKAQDKTVESPKNDHIATTDQQTSEPDVPDAKTVEPAQAEDMMMSSQELPSDGYRTADDVDDDIWAHAGDDAMDDAMDDDIWAGNDPLQTPPALAKALEPDTTAESNSAPLAAITSSLEQLNISETASSAPSKDSNAGPDSTVLDTSNPSTTVAPLIDLGFTSPTDSTKPGIVPPPSSLPLPPATPIGISVDPGTPATAADTFGPTPATPADASSTNPAAKSPSTEPETKTIPSTEAQDKTISSIAKKDEEPKPSTTNSVKSPASQAASPWAKSTPHTASSPTSPVIEKKSALGTPSYPTTTTPTSPAVSSPLATQHKPANGWGHNATPSMDNKNPTARAGPPPTMNPSTPSSPATQQSSPWTQQRPPPAGGNPPSRVSSPVVQSRPPPSSMSPWDRQAQVKPAPAPVETKPSGGGLWGWGSKLAAAATAVASPTTPSTPPPPAKKGGIDWSNRLKASQQREKEERETREREEKERFDREVEEKMAKAEQEAAERLKAKKEQEARDQQERAAKAAAEEKEENERREKEVRAKVEQAELEYAEKQMAEKEQELEAAAKAKLEQEAAETARLEKEAAEKKEQDAQDDVPESLPTSPSELKNNPLAKVGAIDASNDGSRPATPSEAGADAGGGGNSGGANKKKKKKGKK